MERCPKCRAPRLPTPRCPECGQPYPPEAGPPRTGAVWRGAEDDAQLERRLRMFGPPVVLLLALLLMQTGPGRALSRIFLGMWIHELGHAVAAWFTGFSAFPGPWRTAISDERAAWVTVVMALALGGGAFLLWRRTGRRTWPAVLGALLVLALVLTLGVSLRDARTLITFFGDGGQLVLGTALMATFWVKPGSHLHTTWLRWGFLVIGTVAFMDAAVTWSQAAADPDTIMFGEIDTVGTSDPTRLVDDSGWTVKQLVSRYTQLRWACLVTLAAIYAWGLRRTPAAANDANGVPPAQLG